MGGKGWVDELAEVSKTLDPRTQANELKACLAYLDKAAKEERDAAPPTMSLGAAVKVGMFAKKLQGKAKQLKSLRAQLLVDKREDAQKFADEWSKLIESGAAGPRPQPSRPFRAKRRHPQDIGRAKVSTCTVIVAPRLDVCRVLYNKQTIVHQPWPWP